MLEDVMEDGMKDEISLLFFVQRVYGYDVRNGY